MAAQPIPFKPIPNRNGVLKVIPQNERNYYVVDDVMKILGVSQAKAYRLIKSLRQELIESGRVIDSYPIGKVPKKYFDKRCDYL